MPETVDTQKVTETTEAATLLLKNFAARIPKEPGQNTAVPNAEEDAQFRSELWGLIAKAAPNKEDKILAAHIIASVGNAFEELVPSNAQLWTAESRLAISARKTLTALAKKGEGYDVAAQVRELTMQERTRFD